jgi:hypothetical protein
MHITLTPIDPAQNIIDRESQHILLSFCTLCTLLKGKKLSLQNVFVLILQNDILRNLLKDLLGVDSNFEIVKLFLQYDPSIAKSKYITKFLNTNQHICF